MNTTQRSKVYGFNNSAFGECWWLYPSANSIECDRYVAFSYREGHWTFGNLDRAAAMDSAPFEFPLMAGLDGTIYTHEKGHIKDGRRPTLESGPVDLQAGDNVVHVHQLLPDNIAAGNVDITFTGQYETNGAEYTFGPYLATARTDTRVSGRFIRTKYEGAIDDDWRLGVLKADLADIGETR